MLVDCGATTHIINDDSQFVYIDENYNPHEHYIELADGTRKNNVAKKRGTVIVNIQDESGKVREACLENALYVPSYPQNIFSVQAATQNGAKVNFNSDSAELLSSDGVRFPIQKYGRLYYLCKTRSSEAKRSCDLEGWHRILGHCNKADVLKLEGIVDGMKITNKSNFDCGTCTLAKQCQSRSRIPDARATSPMEFIHSDLSGPVDPAAKDGFRYAITFTDDYSSAIFIYFLKQKSDAVMALEKFIADVSPYGKVKKLRTDNGGEYMSGEFESVLVKNAIRHETSAPYSPHQNGTAERNWRTIFEMGRSLLIESNLPKTLWTYAVMAAVFIRNRCYIQRTNETPYYLLTGYRPNISKMHVFGSICYSYVQNKKKLDCRSKEGLFVGYDKNSPAYLIYDPESKTVSKHRIVKFTENFLKAPAKQIPVMDSDMFDDFEIETTKPNEVDVEDELNNYNEDELNNNNENELNIDNDNVDIEINNDEINIQESINEQNQNQSRYGRNRHPPEYLRHYVKTVEDNLLNVDFCYKVVPRSYKDAMKSDESEKWKKAMDEEV